MRNPVELVRYVSRAPELFTASKVSPRWFSWALGYAKGTSISFPFDLPLRGGVTLRLMHEDELAVVWHIFVRKCYSPASTDRVIVDLGANIGAFAAFAAQAAPRAQIISIEPFPATYARLQEHVRRNGLTNRVRALNLAIGGSDGVRQMAGGDDASTLRRVRLDTDDDNPSVDVPVECRSLGSLFDDLDVDDVDYLKMDVEGAEHETLLGTPASVLRRIRRMDVEVHEVNAALGYSAERLMAHLVQAGFRVSKWNVDHHGTGMARLERLADR